MNIFGMNLEELQQELHSSMSLPKFRAKQILEWIYQRGAASFEEMTNLSKELRGELALRYEIGRATLRDRLDSSDGKTSKFLLAFPDNTSVEAVLMRQHYGNSICISSQAGCNMGCVFCASALRGMDRNLEKGEFLAQTIYINELLKVNGEKVDTIVVMGSGEPLMNYDNLLGFLRLVHEPYGLNLGYRSITVSTSGIVPNMYRLMEEELPITLSISLHAPNDALRSRLMPINKKYPLKDVVAAGRAYGERTKRRVTYEYILIDHVNDGEEQARELCHLLEGQLANVNLIPINPVKERNLLRPSPERIRFFEKFLQSRHINVTLRKEMGADINAACGQLRNRNMKLTQ